jgi:hypothetical protein
MVTGVALDVERRRAAVAVGCGRCALAPPVAASERGGDADLGADADAVGGARGGASRVRGRRRQRGGELRAQRVARAG